jgi:hypothetical protein
MHIYRSFFYTAISVGLTSLTAANSPNAVKVDTPVTGPDLSDTPLCADVFKTLGSDNDDTIKSVFCHMPANPQNKTLSPNPEIPRGPYCSGTDNPPDSNDSLRLCALLPGSYVLQPAYGPNNCACETWSLRSAAFAFCNCDTCRSIQTTTSLGSICTSIRNNCQNRGWREGYMEEDNPSSYWSLYPSGGVDNLPVYTTCG